jgi:dephospho-CoA kinase
VVLVVLAMMGWLAFRTRQRMRRLVRVALTGNIASGKTAVTEVWRENGAVIIDADDLARRAVLPGTDALKAVVASFGDEVLLQDGSLDRGALRRVVFGNDEKRRTLESIVHPEVERLRVEEEREAVRRGERLVVHAIPLLFETGLDARFDLIVLVDAPEDMRLERIVQTRGLPHAEAEAMVRAQMPVSEKWARSHFHISNDAGLDELRERAEQVWAEIRARVD